MNLAEIKNALENDLLLQVVEQKSGELNIYENARLVGWLDKAIGIDKVVYFIFNAYDNKIDIAKLDNKTEVADFLRLSADVAVFASLRSAAVVLMQDLLEQNAEKAKSKKARVEICNALYSSFIQGYRLAMAEHKLPMPVEMVEEQYSNNILDIWRIKNNCSL